MADELTNPQNTVDVAPSGEPQEAQPEDALVQYYLGQGAAKPAPAVPQQTTQSALDLARGTPQTPSRAGSDNRTFSEKLADALNQPRKPGQPILPFSKLMVKAGAEAMQSSQLDASLEPSEAAWRAATSGQDVSQPTPAPVAASRPGPVDRALANLGDAAAGAESGKGGFFGGFARAAGARTARTQQEQRDRIATADANARMLHEQYIIHQLGEKEIQDSIASSKPAIQTILDSGGRTVTQNVTSDQLHDMLKKGELKPADEFVFADGRIPIGKDANGVPLYRTTYTVLQPGGPITFNSKNADELAYLNKWAHTEFPASTDDKPETLTAVQYYRLKQTAQNNQAFESNLKAILAKNDVTIHEGEEREASQAYGTDSDIQKAIAYASHRPDGNIDPLAFAKAYFTLMSTPGFLEKHPNFQSRFKQFVDSVAPDKDEKGSTLFDRQLRSYTDAQIKLEAGASINFDGYLKPGGLNYEQADDAIEEAKDVLQNPIIAGHPEDPNNKAILGKAQRVLDIANQVKKDHLQSIHDEALAKAKAEAEAQQEITPPGPMTPAIQADLERVPDPQDKEYLSKLDPNLLMDIFSVAYGAGQTDFDKLFTARKYRGVNILSSQEALPFVKRANPNFDEGAYRQMHDLYHEYTTPGRPAADQINQYNNMLEHAGQFADLVNSVRNPNAPPIWNTGLNKVQQYFGGDTYTKIVALRDQVLGEYEALKAGGYKPDSGTIELHDQAISPGATPGQINAFVKAIAETGAVRLNQLNEDYKTVSNKNFPNILRPHAKLAVEKIGADKETTDTLNQLDSGGRLFSNVLPQTQGTPKPNYAEILSNPPLFNGVRPTGAAPGKGADADKIFWYRTLPNGKIQVLGRASELEQAEQQAQGGKK